MGATFAIGASNGVYRNFAIVFYKQAATMWLKPLTKWHYPLGASPAIKNFNCQSPFVATAIRKFSALPWLRHYYRVANTWQDIM